MKLERKKDEQNTFNELDKFLTPRRKVYNLPTEGEPPIELGRVGDLADDGGTVYIKSLDGTWRPV